MCLKLVVDMCSDAERDLVENIAALQKNKSGRGGGGKVRGASSRPQRKKSAAAKAKRNKTPPSPGLAGPSGFG